MKALKLAKIGLASLIIGLSSLYCGSSSDGSNVDNNNKEHVISATILSPTWPTSNLSWYRGEEFNAKGFAYDSKEDNLTCLWDASGLPITHITQLESYFEGESYFEAGISIPAKSSLGSYILSFNCTDKAGLNASDEETITLKNNLPIAEAGDNTLDAIAGVTSVQLDGSASYDPDGTGPMNGISKCEWNYTGNIGMDGNNYDWSSTTTCSTNHIYPAGTFYPTLRVTDTDGGQRTDSKIVIVK